MAGHIGAFRCCQSSLVVCGVGALRCCGPFTCGVCGRRGRVQAGKWRDAIAAYTDALAVDPSNRNYTAKLCNNRAAAYLKCVHAMWSYLVLASRYRNQLKGSESVVLRERLLWTCGCAFVSCRVNNFDAAFKDCSTTLDIDEDNVKALMRRAQCGTSLGGVENLEVRLPRPWRV